MITKKDLEEQRECIQDDLLTLLDGMDDEFLDKVCDVIVDRFNILINKMEV